MHACVPTDAIRLDGSRTATMAGPPGSRWNAGDAMDRALLDVMTCIRLGLTLEEAGRALWVNHERHLKSPAAMAALFHDQPRALAMTREVADRCAFTLKDLGYRFPDYPLPHGETPDSYLHALTWAGARERWGTPTIACAVNSNTN